MTDNKKGEEPRINLWVELRKPFPPEVVGKLPKGSTTLDFVGHAAVTDRLNSVVGPHNWELKPMAVDEYGRPVLDGNDLWCWLTILGTTKMCVGDGPNNKVRIGDALRNGAMRFGIALDLWTKDELESTLDQPQLKNKPSVGSAPAPATALQLRQIVDTMRDRGIEDDAMANILADDYGVRDPHKMTEVEAARVLDKLRARA